MEITPLENWICQRIWDHRQQSEHEKLPRSVDFKARSGSDIGRSLREQIEIWQLEMLRDTVRWARKQSAFYRERLAGFPEEELRTLEAP